MKIVEEHREFQSLNSILPEGIPQSSTIALVGAPGVGKTILSSQLMFELEPGMKAIWFSTFSEPQNVLISHLSGFDFYEKNKIGNDIQFIDLGSIFNQEKNLEKVMEIIENEVSKYEADVIFIDSFRQMLQWADYEKHSFGLVQNMPTHFAMRGVTTFLLSEYDQNDINEIDFFGMVDGLIRVSFEKEEYNRKRYIEVLKMRGVPFETGMHPVRITDEGFHIYAKQKVAEIKHATTERISTGIKGVDNMLDGGILKNSFVMINGASGTGKSTFGLHFLAEGVMQGEKVLHFSLEEERPQILRNAYSIGFDFVKAEKDGQLIFANPEYDDANVEEVLEQIQELVDEHKVSRIFFDPLTTLSHFQADERFHHFVQSLRAFLKEKEVTLVGASETSDVTSTRQREDVRVSSVADAAIALRYVEDQAKMRRAIMILKIRGSDHDKSLREYTITNRGLNVGQKLSGIEGILSGSTHKVGRSTSEKIQELLTETFGPLAENTFKELSEMKFEESQVHDYFNDLSERGVLPKEKADQTLHNLTSILKA